MNDVTVVTSVTYPSPESLALVADVQYHEPYLSAALNRKFRGIVDPGFYAGFLPKPGGGMNLLITSVDGDKTAGAASVDIGEFYQVTIQHRKDISLALSAGKKYAIVLKGRYLLGGDTYQVNTASHIHAAEFVTRTYTDSYQLGDGELLVCTVNIPAGVSAITQEMIDTSERINRTIGIDISDSVTSTRSDVAASSLAVKKAYDLAKSKYTAQDASTTQKGLVQLSSETNSDSETMAATPKAVKSVKDLADTKAPIESPSLTGTPTAPTAAQGTNSTQIANTAFVKAAITALINGAPGTLDTLKEIAAAINNDQNFSTTINNALALKAPLASPALTGVPTAPTAAQGTNNTQIATTAYVRAAISALVGSSPEALDTLNELAAALGNDPNFATTMTNALAGKQPLDATLTALAGLATGANKLPYFTGKDTVAQTDLTSVGRDILAKTSTLAVIQYLGLRELGTSGEKIPLLSTANTWSARQTFNGGITGALAGNADTATKLKTARNINGVRFDGSADININTLVSRGRVTALEANAQGTSGIQLYEAYNNGYPSPYGNVLHLKGATAAGEGELFIGWSGTSGAHAPVHIRSRRDTDSANWSEWAQVYTSKDSIPGVNAKGNQDTSGNAATATKLQTACTINGVSFDGSKNIELTAEDLNLEQTVELAAGALQKNQNGADIPDKDRFLSNINVYSKGEVDKKKGMRQYVFNAPSNAVGGKWYPVIFQRSTGSTGELASRVIITTTSAGGNYEMNNCEFNGMVMPSGWTDRGSYAAGYFSTYQTNERAIHSIVTSLKEDDVCSVFYVEGRAFPVRVSAEEGLTVIVPTQDYTVGQTTYKWGATNPATESTNAQAILDFNNGRGFYCSHSIFGINAIFSGNLGIGTANALGGNSIVLGDNDTGFKQNGDGVLDAYANGVHVFRFINGSARSLKGIQAGESKFFTLSSANTAARNASFNLWGNSSRPTVAELGDDSGWHFYSQRNTDNSVIFAVNGQIQPSNWGNIDSRYVKDVRLGSQQYYGVNNWQTWNFQCPSGHVLSGINVQDTGSNSADNIAGVYYRPVQKYINGTWYNVASV
ncbi:tail fiber protein [Escherichia coli]|nr:phage tail protein [Escherichia coli]EEQ7371898.1 phage tail protein [Escherichia coli]EEV0044020.1 phage tail protein [Escherichia coli]EFD0355072.1 phage tail protein [Escherichia coli]EHI6419822.1 phage tail protein [Escherichia coli]EHV3249009.1 tail fiber protein [Escherichia coli]